jgi:hypothetical protein
MTALQRLQRWYSQQCNEEWEYHHGIQIESLDNPGWLIKVDLTGTPLAGVPFLAVADNVDSQHFQLGPRWMDCYVDGPIWRGAGDETKLEPILELFLGWAERKRQ